MPPNRAIAAACCAALVLPCTPLVARADVPIAGYQQGSGPWFKDILPPGTNGLVNGVQLAQYGAGGQRPAHNDDQLAMYGDLVYATPRAHGG